MKKPQWITIGIAAVLTLTLFFFGRTVPEKKPVVAETHSEDDGHNHGNTSLSTDSILAFGKKQLNPEQVSRLSMLENSISRGNVKSQQLQVYHQLSHFWGDSMGFFPAYSWYEAEAARLENSEKTLTFAARLFLENLRQEPNPGLRQWEALQAKDLLERSLKLNPDNDSAKVGIGACYLFGGISDAPMQGVSMIQEVVNRDSTNTYAQLTLAEGALMSGQLDKAIARLQTVYRLEPTNVSAILLLADVRDRTGNKKEAVRWYEESLQYIKRKDVVEDIRKRIEELKK